MASATNPELGPPFDAGRALAHSVAILASNVGALVLMTVLIHLPVLLVQLFLIASPHLAARAPQQQVALLFAAGMFFSALAAGAVTHAALQQLLGQPGSFALSLRVAVVRSSKVLLINLVTLTLLLMSSVALFLPGFLAATLFFVATPVAVLEGRGLFASLRRSIELTRGARWGVFGVLMIPISVVFGLHLLALLAVGDLHAERPLENPRFQAASAVLSVLFQALSAVTSTVVYLELRRRAEGAEKAAAPVAAE